MAEWAIDDYALAQAARRLKLSRPVRVDLRELEQDWARYRGVRDGSHQITLNPTICVWQAGAALWHELTHAQQAETIDDFWAAYRQSPTAFEDLAEANEELNGWIPLCLPC